MTPAPESKELVALRELHRIVLLVNSEHDLSAVLETAAQGVVDVLGFQAVVVNLVTPRGDFEAVTVLGPPRESLLGARTPREVFLAELAAADVWGTLRFVPEGRHPVDLHPDSSWTSTEPVAEGPGAWQREDALYAPFHTPEGELLGILSVDLPDDGQRPGPTRREVLEMYAVQMGRAIAHARERERLAERLRLTTATRRILQAGAVSDDLDAVLEASIEPIRSGFLSQDAWVRLFADPGGAWPEGSYPALAGSEVPDPSIDLEESLERAERAAHACWRAQRTLVVSRTGPDTSAEVIEPEAHAQALDWLEALEHDQFVLTPIGEADQCVGYVMISRRRGLDWSEVEEQAALDVGRELGRLIGAARLRAREHEVIKRLEELDDYKSRVVTTLIHELKNPLAVVLGNLELARDAPESVDKAHTAIDRGARRMQSLVDDLLVLTRLRTPAADLPLVPVDLGAAVREVVALAADPSEAEGVHVDVGGVGDVRVLGDRTELERLVLNLVSNAVKYSDPGSTVTVTLTASGDRAVLAVADTGIGIASEDMGSIFGEFDRSSNPQARSRPGSGLGLPIVRRVVQRHGGVIEVESTLGQGSRFVVTLPIGQSS